MTCYANPYEGDQDYIFFSYCHEDAARVYPMIERLSIEGFRVWYDDGIHPGENWPEMVADHLDKASVCIVAMSQAAAESHNCRNEINLAVGDNIPLLPILLEAFQMTRGIRLQLSGSRYIEQYRLEEEAFYRTLIASPCLKSCGDADRRADESALELWRRHCMEYEDFSPKPEDDTAEKAEQAALAAARDASTAERNAKKAADELKIISSLGEVSEKNLAIAEEYLQNARQAAADARVSAEAAQKAAEKASTPRANTAAENARNSAEAAREFAAAAAAAYESVLSKAAAPADGDDSTIFIPPAPPASDEQTVQIPLCRPALFVRLKTGETLILNRQKTVIGIKRDRCDVVISRNPRISREHVRIESAEPGMRLINLKPTNGTAVNGHALEHGESAELPPCSVITLADEDFLLLHGKAFDQAFDDQKICLLTSVKTGETKMIGAEGISLDRNHRTQWRESVLEDRQISRKEHAKVRYEHGQCRILRHKAEAGKPEHNAVSLNGQELIPGRSELLHDGDRVSVVEEEFLYREVTTGKMNMRQ